MEKYIPYEKLLQEGKAQAGQRQARHLGRTQPHHPEAKKQQSLQQKTDTGLEERTSRSCVVFIAFDRLPPGFFLRLRCRNTAFS